MKRTELERNPGQARAWERRSRRPLPVKSRRRRTGKTGTDKVRAEVFDRDGGCMLQGIGPACLGRLTYHHRRKAGAGGAYTPDNGVALCVRHNLLVEDEPGMFVGDGHLADLGLVVREGDPEWERLGKRANR